MRIYTKTGDKGETGYIGGRISKSSKMMKAIGDIDELNSILGVVIATSEMQDINNHLLDAQSRLFEIGALIADKERNVVNYSFSEQTESLEKLIDEYTHELPELESFILPGGSLLSSYLHHARSVCRRAERALVDYYLTADIESANGEITYLNRLSDLLFTFARYANNKTNTDEIKWNSN